MKNTRKKTMTPRRSVKNSSRKKIAPEKRAFCSINVRDFVFKNLHSYNGDESFLVGPTEKTQKLWEKCLVLMKKEREKGGVLDIDVSTVSRIASHDPGYIEKDLEVVVGLQTDAPLKRAIKPYGGIRIVMKACEEAGYKLDPKVSEIFLKYVKTHNDGVFDGYTEEMRKLRKTGVLTGLPDAYARGRIIGDCRRVALYGIDKLIEEKKKDKEILEGPMTEAVIQLREEISEQILALELMKKMAAGYGFDIARPAENAREAVQWVYFAYLAAVKEHDGAAMSLGNVSGFLDIYIEKDIKAGKLSEAEAQELVDQFVMKLRLVRHLRTTEYNELFAGDPTWVTESLAGAWCDGRHKVTKTTYRFLHTLYNLGPSPEPNLTILWSKYLPENFKKFCAKVSIETSSLQYENDDLMRKAGNCDDYGISCCVSRLESGKQMQFFGARCNIAKALLLAINHGVDEVTGIQIVDGIAPLKGKYLQYDVVMKNFKKTSAFLAEKYVDTMNVIHYMHDKYYYERAQMALIDSVPKRVMAFGLAGLSVAADSLSAIRHTKVLVERDERGIAVKFDLKSDYPKFGNDDKRVDKIATQIVSDFSKELHKHHIYRNASPTLSVLTITSNVVYGKKTGSTPDGRLAGEPFAPGANPMHGRDTHGAIASLNSVAKISYHEAQDGVSNTFSITPQTLGHDTAERSEKMVALLDGYFAKSAHHLNVNVLNRKTLEDAMEHPEKYPQLTIRVSGYAVNFVKLNRSQQQEVLARTFFEAL